MIDRVPLRPVAGLARARLAGQGKWVIFAISAWETVAIGVPRTGVPTITRCTKATPPPVRAAVVAAACVWLWRHMFAP